MKRRKSEQKKLLGEIQSLSESIRHKHSAIKLGIAETTSTLQKTFRPLVEPLTTLTKQLGNKNENVRVLLEEKKLDTHDDDGKIVSTPRKLIPYSASNVSISTPRFQQTHTVFETLDSPADVYLSTPEGLRKDIEMLDRFPYGMLAKEYMKRFITDASNTIDHTYGSRMKGDKIMLGDETLELDKNDLYVKGSRYTETQGLCKLIFMKNPDKEYLSHNDMNADMSIFISTNAHRQRYKPDKQINSNASYKYRTVT